MKLPNPRAALGAGLVEYAVIVHLLAIGSIGLCALFGDNIRSLFSAQANCLSGQERCVPATRKAEASDYQPLTLAGLTAIRSTDNLASTRSAWTGQNAVETADGAPGQHGTFDQATLEKALASLDPAMQHMDYQPGPSQFDPGLYKGFRTIKTGLSGNQGGPGLALVDIQGQSLADLIFPPVSGLDFMNGASRADIVKELSEFSNDQLEWMTRGLVFPPNTSDPAEMRYLAVEEKHNRGLEVSALTEEQATRWRIAAMPVPLDDPRAEYRIQRIAFTVKKQPNPDYYVEVILPKGFERRIQPGLHASNKFRSDLATYAHQSPFSRDRSHRKILDKGLIHDGYGWPRGSLEKYPVTVRIRRGRLDSGVTVANYQIQLQPGHNQFAGQDGVLDLTIDLAPTFNLPCDEVPNAHSMATGKSDLESEAVPPLPEKAGFDTRGGLIPCISDSECGGDKECLPAGRCGRSTAALKADASGALDHLSHFRFASKSEHKAFMDTSRIELERRKWVNENMPRLTLSPETQQAYDRMLEQIRELELAKAISQSEDLYRLRPETDLLTDVEKKERMTNELISAWPHASGDSADYVHRLLAMSLQDLREVRQRVENKTSDAARAVHRNVKVWIRERLWARQQVVNGKIDERHQQRSAQAWKAWKEEENGYYQRYKMGPHGLIDLETGRQVH